MKNNVKRKHGQNIDEYRADYYATKHMKNGYKAQKNSNKDVFKRVTKSNKFRKKSKENIKKEFDFRNRMHSFIDKQKEAEYLRK